MNSRERVKRSMHFQTPDMVPVQFYYCPVGYYEHGEKLNDLYNTLHGDFAPYIKMPIPKINPSDYDENGNYHAFYRDEWNTLWEYRIFGVTGIPIEFPLEDISNLDTFVFPAPPVFEGQWFDEFCKMVAEHQKNHYFSQAVGSLFERLIALRPEVDVLCDIELDEPEINVLADKIIDYYSNHVTLAIKSGANGINFGDDYGTERGLIMSPDTWRRFIKPRLQKLFEPAVNAGLDIHFHSCGLVFELLPDFKEIGVTSIWPQLPAYDMEELAKQCRQLGLATAIHTDRAQTMTYGTPEDVRALVKREFEVFRMSEGGSWFYVEADNGFPFENIKALIETIAELRK